MEHEKRVTRYSREFKEQAVALADESLQVAMSPRVREIGLIWKRRTGDFARKMLSSEKSEKFCEKLLSSSHSTGR